MTKELKSYLDSISNRQYKNAHRDLDKIFNRLSKKDVYFILKKYYSFINDSLYKPNFDI